MVVRSTAHLQRLYSSPLPPLSQAKNNNTHIPLLPLSFSSPSFLASFRSPIQACGSPQNQGHWAHVRHPGVAATFGRWRLSPHRLHPGKTGHCQANVDARGEAERQQDLLQGSESSGRLWLPLPRQRWKQARNQWAVGDGEDCQTQESFWWVRCSSLLPPVFDGTGWRALFYQCWFSHY